ncbi:MAG: DUF3857 domain-containing protein [Bacteroidales bacterium]
MKNLLVILLLGGCFSLFAQNKYNYSTLPEELKKNANYIFWENFREFEVIDIGRAVEKVRMAVCIVDQYSKAYNGIYAPYRKFEKISGFKAEIFDQYGNSVKKLKSSDIQDVSAVSDYSLFEDDRMLYAELIHGQYPYTLVFEYEKKVEGLLNYPIFYFQPRYNSGVVLSQLNLIVPNDFLFRYKEFNLTQPSKVKLLNGKRMYTWQMENLKPFEEPEMTPPQVEFEQMVMLAPIQFGEGGYTGKMDNWENFGKWLWGLNINRNSLSEDRTKEILNLFKDVKDDREKVKILYKFMQNRTRFVSVQLGIGGYQPFAADFVDSKGYGDCKALVNYMSAILNVAGIKSYYTIINAGEGEEDIITEFPANQFNHVILCVPQPKDTIWLECTSQEQPFNFLGRFTDDRHALMVTENGGKLVKTPVYDKNQNLQSRKAVLKIGENGFAKGEVKTSFFGLQYENREGWNHHSPKEQKDALKEDYTLAGLEITNFSFHDLDTPNPCIIEQLGVDINGFASITGKRMFMKLNAFNESSYVPKNEERKLPFRLTYAFTDVDSVQIEIPAGYTVESMPQPIELNTKFGGYSIKVIQEGNKITYIRKYYTEKGIFQTQDYAAYYDFRKQLVKADKAKLVLVKNI